MNVERMILLVQERPILWDPSEPGYHMRQAQRKLWIEVANELKESVDDVKKKWRGLRDTFRKEMKKHILQNSEPKWIFYNLLQFLTDACQPIKVNGSLEHSDAEDSEIMDGSDYQREDYTVEIANQHDDDFHTPHVCIVKSEDAQELNTQTTERRLVKVPPKKLKLVNYEEKLVEPEHKKSSYSEQNSQPTQDSDYQFLMSLHPYLQDVPKERKLAVRMRLMQVLLDDQ